MNFPHKDLFRSDFIIGDKIYTLSFDDIGFHIGRNIRTYNINGYKFKDLNAFFKLVESEYYKCTAKLCPNDYIYIKDQYNNDRGKLWINNIKNLKPTTTMNQYENLIRLASKFGMLILMQSNHTNDLFKKTIKDVIGEFKNYEPIKEHKSVINLSIKRLNAILICFDHLSVYSRNAMFKELSDELMEYVEDEYSKL